MTRLHAAERRCKLRHRMYYSTVFLATKNGEMDLKSFRVAVSATFISSSMGAVVDQAISGVASLPV